MAEYKEVSTKALNDVINILQSGSDHAKRVIASFDGSVVTKGEGEFKDAKVLTFLSRLTEGGNAGLNKILKGLSVYCEKYCDDDEPAKWIMGSIIEYINSRMLEFAGIMMSHISIELEKSVKGLEGDDANKNTEINRLVKTSAQKVLKIFDENSGFATEWRSINRFAVENGISPKRANEYLSIMDSIQGVMQKRFDAQSSKEKGENSSKNLAAWEAAYIERFFNPIMQVLEVFSNAKENPGIFTEDKDKAITADIEAMKANGFIPDSSDNSAFYYPKPEVIKEWFNYILGLNGENEPKNANSDFRDKAQSFREGMMRTYQAMKENWEGSKGSGDHSSLELNKTE